MNMSVFSVPVTIGVDEDKIAREIEKEAKEKVIRNISDKVEGIIYRESYGYYTGNVKQKDDTPLRNMVEGAIKDTLLEKEEKIIELAAEKLADKLSRQKAVKSVGAEVAKDVLEG